MDRSVMFRVLADVVLVVHVSCVIFLVLGLVLIVAGGLRRWAWTRSPWFRAVHLAVIGVVAGQAWCGAICPLTSWEMRLRDAAGEATYQGAFVAHWLQRLLYYEAPPWVFVVAYTVFGLAVAGAWWVFPPRPFRR